MIASGQQARNLRTGLTLLGALLLMLGGSVVYIMVTH